jgi:hypothetical protein
MKLDPGKFNHLHPLQRVQQYRAATRDEIEKAAQYALPKATKPKPPRPTTKPAPMRSAYARRRTY